jgi:hypothetical protein
MKNLANNQTNITDILRMAYCFPVLVGGKEPSLPVGGIQILVAFL